MEINLALGKDRVSTAFGRLFRLPTVPLPSSRAPMERPAVIVAIFLPLALLLMFSADYSLGVWMKKFPHDLKGGARWITNLGEGVEVLVLTGAVLTISIFIPRNRMRRRMAVGANAITAIAAYVFLAVAGGGLTAAFVKNAVGRARPGLLDSHGYLYFQPFTFDASFAAFPSGHSATAGAMAMSLALAFPRFKSLFIPLGALICLSRQLVGAHWSSDTLMGWAVGVAFALWLAHVFARRKLMFVYDSDGCLRHKKGRRVIRAFWNRAYSACHPRVSNGPFPA